jgi:hypothetical protein
MEPTQQPVPDDSVSTVQTLRQAGSYLLAARLALATGGETGSSTLGEVVVDQLDGDRALSHG